MKLKEIDEQLSQLDGDVLVGAIEVYRSDARQGVQKLCEKHQRRWQKTETMREEWRSKEAFDTFFHEGTKVVVGVDEVGRGPLAGPVVAAAVILPYTCDLLGVKDSKKLSEEKREDLYERIQQEAYAIGIGIVDAQTIDEINILQATFLAMRKALDALGKEWQVLLVDGDKIIPGVDGTQHAVIKGDDKSGAIAAASVVAKVTRDRMMKAYAMDYPHYEWESNKGYGSAKHYEGIRNHGMTSLHRRTFLKNEG